MRTELKLPPTPPPHFFYFFLKQKLAETACNSSPHKEDKERSRTGKVTSADTQLLITLTDLLDDEISQHGELRRRQVKGSELQALANFVADVGVEKECHSLGPQIAITILLARSGVDLGVSVQVLHALNVHHNQLVA